MSISNYPPIKTKKKKPKNKNIMLKNPRQNTHPYVVCNKVNWYDFYEGQFDNLSQNKKLIYSEISLLGIYP